MRRKPFVVLGLAVLTATAAWGKDSAGNAQRNSSGGWTASASNGLILRGTWTAVPNPANSTVTGTWTLDDTQGRTVATGGWSAAKSATRWTGAWRAVVSGKQGEYSGTWATSVDLTSDARFADLFEKAIDAAVNGTWRMGKQWGAWAIRTSK